MVSQAFVRRFMRGRDPIGAWFRIGDRDRQVVGVVQDGPMIRLKERIEPFFYFPFAQMPTGGEVTLLLESAGDPQLLAASVRTMARRESASFVVWDLHTMRQYIFTARKEDAILTGLFLALAVLGLLLAAAGLFGVTRTRLAGACANAAGALRSAPPVKTFAGRSSEERRYKAPLAFLLGGVWPSPAAM